MVKKITKKLFRAMGYEINKYSPYPHRLSGFFRAWQQLGTSPTFIVDVGANHGSWSRNAISYFPQARFLLVEPQERLKVYSTDLLRHPNVSWMTTGVSDQVGQMLLTLPPRDDSATFSISSEKAQAAGYPQISVPVTTLNEIIKQENQYPDIIKIDAEGFDMKVLTGASKAFGVAEVIIVECTVCGRAFDNGHLDNSLLDVLKFMDERGYRVFDFTDLNMSPKHGVLWLIEVVFVKSSSPVWTKITDYA